MRRLLLIVIAVLFIFPTCKVVVDDSLSYKNNTISINNQLKSKVLIDNETDISTKAHSSVDKAKDEPEKKKDKTGKHNKSQSTSGMSSDDIDLVALVTMAEAECEPEEGKRLVIDTILNRKDSKNYPNDIYGVVYQPSQFSSMWDGRIDSCYVDEKYVQLVKEELKCRTNYEVIYFRMDYYSEYGTPMFNIGNHYFSSY